MLDAPEALPSIDPLLKRGLNFHEAGSNLAAAKIFELAYRREPSSMPAILNMGSSYYKAKYYPEAEEAYREALKKEPNNATAHYGLGMIYEEIGDRPAARIQFRKAAELNPESGKAWLSLAQVTHDETPRLQALHHATEWAKKQLNNCGLGVSDLMEVTACLQQANLYAEAKIACEIALKQEPTSHAALSRLIVCNLWLHDYTAAANVNRAMIMACEPAYERPTHDKAFARSATKALIEIQKTLSEANVTFFLIAGTLLGCIRDKGPLAHDKDVDIGFMSDVSNKTIIEALRANTEFTCPLNYSEDDIYFGTSYQSTGVDLFRHEINADYIWCGFARHPGCMKWQFTPFGLKQETYFDLPFNIPDNPSLYLMETYGDWQIPDTGLTSVLSSPARFDMEDEFLRYISYSRLWLAAHRKDITHLNRIFEQTPEAVRQDAPLHERLIILSG